MSDQVLKEILETQRLIIKTLEQHGVQLQSLNERVAGVEYGQLRLESRMENEVIDKIRTLFNGYSLRGDQIESLKKHIDERLDSIETDTRYLVARVACLEKLAK